MPRHSYPLLHHCYFGDQHLALLGQSHHQVLCYLHMHLRSGDLLLVENWVKTPHVMVVVGVEEAVCRSLVCSVLKMIADLSCYLASSIGNLGKFHLVVVSSLEGLLCVTGNETDQVAVVSCGGGLPHSTIHLGFPVAVETENPFADY